ncbi:MAG: hypothetical protein RI947_1565 [Candidatus Parcubacteria bacterium]|jgi:uncharacterized protein YutE (UPF0331/DUF86 family)
MKLIGFIALIIVLFASLFHIAGADLTNNVLGVALMVLLSSLFSDLKEFNFWGLKGVSKEEEKLKKLKGEEGITTPKKLKFSQSKVQQAVRHDTVVTMDNQQANFLALAFEIERLMRISATVLLGEELPAGINQGKVVDILYENGVLTSAGREQIDSIRWLRNMLVQGRATELAKDTLRDGIDISLALYTDLKTWLDTIQIPSK